MTRTFTRTLGLWTPNSLAGQYAFCAEAGQYYAGSWLPIAGNSSNVLSFATDVPANTSSVRVSPWSPITNRYPCDYGANGGNGRFWGGCLDTKRRKLWPAPNGSDVFVRFDLASRQIDGVWEHGYPKLPSYPYLDSVFFGMIYDASRDIILTIPGICPDIVVIDPSTEEFIPYPHGQEYRDPENPNPNGLFNSGFLAASELWLIPYASNSFVIFNLDTHVIERFTLPAGFRLYSVPGGVYDGSRYWYGASDEGFIIRLDVSNRTAEKIMNPYYLMPSWDPNLSYYRQPALYSDGCILDNRVYFSPDYGPILDLDLNSPTNKISHIPLSGIAAYTNFPAGVVGQYMKMKSALGWLWFFGLNNPVLSALNPATRKLYTFPYGTGQGAWCDAAWDEEEQSFFTYPCIHPSIAQITPDLEKIQMLEAA